jgi:hypothetical protein
MTMVTKSGSGSTDGSKTSINLLKKKPDVVVKKEWEVNTPGSKSSKTKRPAPKPSSGSRESRQPVRVRTRKRVPEKKVERREYTVKSAATNPLVMDQIQSPTIKVKRTEKKKYSKKPTGGKKFKVSRTSRLFKPGKKQRKQACKTRKCLDLAR